MKSDMSKVNGFDVIVLDGKEITETQYKNLSEHDRSRVKFKVNGPHHGAKWARDLVVKDKGGAS